MSLKIVSDIKDANFITHSGSFHADEIFCTILFEMLFGEVNLFRTRDLTGANQDAIIFDVGSGELDHHQDGGNGLRDNLIKYAAFGLVWKKYGKDLLKKLNVANIDEVFEEFDKIIIAGMDAFDNGQLKTEAMNNGLLNINTIIEHLNPGFGSGKSENDQFLKAFEISKEVFISELDFINLKQYSKKIVEDAINSSENRIMFLNSRVPWDDILLNSSSPKALEVLYVIRPGKKIEDGYSVNTVPLEPKSFDHRLFFPREWGGKTPEELRIMTGIETLRFCHQNCFLCEVGNLEDAYSTAELSMKLQNVDTIKR